jgi:sortase (surface protein transpeptidase)
MLMFSWSWFQLVRLGLSLAVVALLGASYGRWPWAEAMFWFDSHGGKIYSLDPSLENTAQVDKVVVIEPISRQASVVIEKLHVNEALGDPIDYLHPAAFESALQRHGVVLGEGLALPGQNGVTYLFAHSLMHPWQLGQFATPFMLLHHLGLNDRINVFYNNARFTYSVVSKQVASPSQIATLAAPYSAPTLFLQSCDPQDASSERLLIVATLVP